MFENKTILITGGTGTFGNAVAQRYLKEGVGEIRIFSRDEKKQDDMRNEIHDSRLKFFIGDVRDSHSLRAPMYGVDYVFHAAALKQVPSCEFFPLEAVLTNTLGAENVLTVARENGVKNIIALSTDKAAYPICAMGMSKALMEKVLVAQARTISTPILCCTRYGNVMGSRGSVIPLFIRQIKMGGPITITDPEMTRFMMTIDDAVNLVVYAFENSKAGDIFVKKSPATTIFELAMALRMLFGANNEIKTIGIRHGEKRFETLVTCEEMVKAEDCGAYYRIPLDARDMNYASYFSEGKSEEFIRDYTSHNTHQLNVEELLCTLKSLDCVKEAL